MQDYYWDLSRYPAGPGPDEVAIRLFVVWFQGATSIEEDWDGLYVFEGPGPGKGHKILPRNWEFV